MSPNLPTSFWSRVGLREEDRDVCVSAIQRLYPAHYCVEEFAEQGYCSFTLVVSPCNGSGKEEDGGAYIVQVRPAQHALDIDVVEAARYTYGGLAPRVRALQCELPGGLKAAEMERLSGMPLSKVLVDMEGAEWEKQSKLVESFARFIARGWNASLSAEKTESTRHTRADTPTEGLWLDQHCTGKVGSVLVPKLRKLAAHLPDEALREKARDTLAQLLAVREYPVVLNHGDLIPSNILIDPVTWEVTGLVDWAEAEFLPFGTCLYGLEYLLGSLRPATRSEKPVWRYYPRSGELRRVFWETLEKERPEAGRSVEEVRCMKDVGVLLWFGYAWDEGAIDRVVNEVDDAVEVACLRAFLDLR